MHALPFAEGSVDFVISSLFASLTAAELTQMLLQWARLARQSLIMTDLVRHLHLLVHEGDESHIRAQQHHAA